MIKKIAHALTRKPKLVALIAVLLLIPSALGYIGTRVNYDILSYLPEDLDSVQGERLLEEPFHMAATSMLIVEGMPAAYTNDLINEIKEVPGVSSAIWLSNAVGIQIPTDFIPAALRDMFFAGDSTMMIIQYEKSGAAEETMQAIDDVRSLCNEKCFLAGFSVVIKDTKDLVDQELPIYVGLAVLLSLVAMSLTMESMVLPFVFLLSIGMAIVYNFGIRIRNISDAPRHIDAKNICRISTKGNRTFQFMPYLRVCFSLSRLQFFLGRSFAVCHKNNGTAWTATNAVPLSNFQTPVSTLVEYNLYHPRHLVFQLIVH